MFLYKPVFEIIDKRKKEIEDNILQAAKKEEEAKDILDEYQRKKAALENNEKCILDAAHSKAAEILKEKTAGLEQEIHALKQKKIEKINKDLEKLKGHAVEKLKKTIFDITRTVFQELSSKKLEESLFDNFIVYMEAELPKITAELDEVPSLKLYTAFELSSENQTRFKQAAEKVLKGAKCQFFIQKDNILGVNLLIDGYELSWNVSKSLKTLEKALVQSVDTAEFLR